MTVSPGVPSGDPPHNRPEEPNRPPPSLALQYQRTLLENVLPFWEQHSLDHEQGGYFTCLDRHGGVFDTDKFIWLQNRQVWQFSVLYNRLEARPQWLAVAKHGADFLAQRGRDGAGNWYFALNRQGQPLIQPYNIFSDCFAAMAFSQYALASQDEGARQIALQAYDNVLRRQHDPKGQYNKAYPGTRPLKSLAVPMILANLTLEMEWLLPPETVDRVLAQTVQEVMGDFYDPSLALMREAVTPAGEIVDSFEGRLLNPGHGIEAMWFMMDIAQRRQDPALLEKAVQIVLSTLDYAWDQELGGIFYFLDSQGHPPQQLEWDQKLWWVHLETLVALAKGYQFTGNPRCWQWFEQVHDYTWSHFADPDAGEWFGYLNRAGEVLLNLKGGKWKGCFHVPRALWLCWQSLTAVEQTVILTDDWLPPASTRVNLTLANQVVQRPQPTPTTTAAVIHSPQAATFLLTATRELGIPLTHMKTALRLLDSMQHKREQRQRYLDLLKQECDRQNSLLTGLQELLQIDQTPLGAHGDDAVRIEDCVPGVVSTYQPIAAEKGIVLGYTIAADYPAIACSAADLRTMLQHLLHNSLKFTPRGGKVYVKAQRQGETIDLIISDTGCGIEMPDLPRVFDCFYRGRNVNAADQGAGLGLTIVQRLVKRRGGTIKVKSHRERGTYFYLSLPMVTAPGKP